MTIRIVNADGPARGGAESASEVGAAFLDEGVGVFEEDEAEERGGDGLSGCGRDDVEWVELHRHDRISACVMDLSDPHVHTLTSLFSSNSTNNFLAAHSLPSIFFASFSPACLFLKSSVEVASSARRAG